MAVSIGKRKRERNYGGDDGAGEEEEDALRARFQRAFEAKFKPLQRVENPRKEEVREDSIEEDSVEEEGSDWSGISEDEEGVEVVDHEVTRRDDADVQKREKKAFMSAKPPISGAKPTPRHQPKDQPANAEEQDSTEATHSKHDLALQRLLKESHLLDPSTYNGQTSSTPEGKGRLKATDLRMRGLGAKQSLAEQEKMPLSHRRGIAAKATHRNEKRRREAAENGVVLEKAPRAERERRRGRERGVAGPTVGKFQGGTLRLSGRDVRAIEGSSSGRRKARR